MQGVEVAWFSDTFLFYSNDATQSSFTHVEGVSRRFIQVLTQREIPARGSLSHGEFLANKSNQIFVGPALVDAHHYGERYNWIGFVLCRSAVQKLPERRLMQHYANWKTEFKIKTSQNTMETKSEDVWAYKMGAGGRQNPCIQSLRRMADRTTDNDHRQKYENSLQFLERC